MEYGAIDLHKKESQIRILTEDGEMVDYRIATTRDRLGSLFAERAPMRVPPPGSSLRAVNHRRSCRSAADHQRAISMSVIAASLPSSRTSIRVLAPRDAKTSYPIVPAPGA